MQTTKFTISLFFIIGIAFIGFSQKEKTDVQKLDLKGNVNVLWEYSYKVKKEGEQITKLERMHADTRDSDKKILFNDNGMYETIYFMNGKDESLGEYRYDYMDNKLSFIFSYDANESIINSHYYSYDYSGVLLGYQVMSTYPDKLEYGSRYTFDDAGRKIEEQQYNGNKQITSSYHYKYDSKDHIIEEDYRIYNNGELVSSSTTNYEYDYNNDKLTEKRAITSDHKIVQGYNEKEDLIKISTYDKDGELTEKSIILYEYAKNGNIMRKEIQQLSKVTEATLYARKKTDEMRKLSTSKRFKEPKKNLPKLGEFELISKKVITYTYDTKYNWLSETIFENDAKEGYRKERDFSYYR